MLNMAIIEEIIENENGINKLHEKSRNTEFLLYHRYLSAIQEVKFTEGEGSLVWSVW